MYLKMKVIKELVLTDIDHINKSILGNQKMTALLKYYVLVLPGNLNDTKIQTMTHQSNNDTESLENLKKSADKGLA